MGRKNHQILGCVLLCLFISCIKDKPPVITNDQPAGTGNVYIVCEGNYGNGNASLYAYQPKNDTVYGDLFKSANSNQPLGDVFQSMTKIGNYFFLVINNSNKVTVIDATTYKLVSTISIPQPRYILITGTNKAYVSSLYSNTVYIINTQTYVVTGTITLPSKNPEGMCLYNNTAIITSWDTTNRYIYLVDVATDKIVENVRVAGLAPQEVFIDKDQLLWVLSGDQTDGKTAALTRIDLSTGVILDSFIFSTMADPMKPILNNTKDSIYFIEDPFNNVAANNGIYRMSIYDKQLPIQPFIAGTQYLSYYALGIDPVTGEIYVGDPKGFIQKGTIYIYKQDGTLTSQFNAGLGPGHFYFDK